METYSFFNLILDGPVAHLKLNRPDKANGMNDDFWNELPEIMAHLEENPSIRALVISGEGKHFSGGMDLSGFDFIYDIMKADPARAAYALRKEILRLQGSFNALEAARFPVIIAVHGACIGASIDMMSACDIRICSVGTKFSIEEINVGMAADVGTLQRLPKIMPAGIVKELSYTGRKFTPEEALSWGFVNRICESRDESIEAAFELAREIASKSPIAVTGVKRALDFARDHSVAESLEQIATWNSAMLRPNELKTAVNARMQRTKAEFDDMLDV